MVDTPDQYPAGGDDTPSTDSIEVSLHVSELDEHKRRKAREDRLLNGVTVEYCEERNDEFLATLPKSLMEEVANERNSISSHGIDSRVPFDRDEVVLGPKLGEGNFCNVYDVACFRLRESSPHGAWSAEDTENRNTMKGIEKYHGTETSRYALKRIKDDFIRERGVEEYIQAAADLALEAELLSILNHPNIIRLRGSTHSGVAGFANGPKGYFLIIDRLTETLDQRIKLWHPAQSKKGRMMKVVNKGIATVSSRLKRRGGSDVTEGSEEEEVLDECLHVALQISAALAYLHDHSVIFRDLKPDNIGFDVRGDVKVFDFGLARVMPGVGDPYCDVFEMSGAGSPRYMAPELLLGIEYNMKADVYTFALVLCEMLTGDAPYSFIKKRQELVDYVVGAHGRPKINPNWPGLVKDMLESSFAANINSRPEMKHFFEKIRQALICMRKTDKGLSESYICHRRTALSFGKSNSKLAVSFRNAAKEVPL